MAARWHRLRAITLVVLRTRVTWTFCLSTLPEKEPYNCPARLHRDPCLQIDPAKRYTQDYDVWFRFAEHSPFVHGAEPLVISRQHESQDSKVKAPACALEADRMHGRMLRTVSSQEVERYVGDTLDYLVESERIFLMRVTCRPHRRFCVISLASCIVFDVPGLDDIISDGENGVRLPQGDISGMAAKVSRLLSDPSLRAEIGSRARELVQRFGRQEICGRFESLVEAVLFSIDTTSLHEVLSERFREPTRDVEQCTRLMITEYERGANTHLFKPYVKAALRKAGKPFRRAT